MARKHRKILVILGNPKKLSLCRSLANSYYEGAVGGGHEVRFLDLSTMKFDPILHEGKDSGQKIEKSVLDARKDISWADHLVFVYPIWWGTFPAVLKGFIDRVFSNGFAYKYVKGERFHRRLMKGKSARLILTMDAHYLLYKLVLRGHGVKTVRLNFFFFTGIGPVKETKFYKVRESSDKKRKKWLDSVFLLGFKGA